MLETLVATRLHRGMSVGRTRPLLLGCEAQNGEQLEAVVKLSSRCDRGPTALAIEGIAAMLGRDLGLNIPRPFVVSIDVDVFDQGQFSEVIADRLASCDPSFGSMMLESGYSVILGGDAYRGFVREAAEIFAFDAAILNADRRVVNPNCQCNGTSFAIFDHEAALAGLDALGTILQPFPWVPGALSPLGSGPGQHVFFSILRGQAPDFSRIEDAWSAISDDRLIEYQSALPACWTVQGQVIDRALEHLASVRTNIGALLDEVKRVIK